MADIQSFSRRALRFNIVLPLLGVSLATLMLAVCFSNTFEPAGWLLLFPCSTVHFFAILFLAVGLRKYNNTAFWKALTVTNILVLTASLPWTFYIMDVIKHDRSSTAAIAIFLIPMLPIALAVFTFVPIFLILQLLASRRRV